VVKKGRLGMTKYEEALELASRGPTDRMLLRALRIQESERQEKEAKLKPLVERFKAMVTKPTTIAKEKDRLLVEILELLT
jgi:hypothetical protein